MSHFWKAVIFSSVLSHGLVSLAWGRYPSIWGAMQAKGLPLHFFDFKSSLAFSDIIDYQQIQIKIELLPGAINFCYF